ncbi:hypothetical protein [Pseudogemmobacter bohemicus]|uniref:hypothetical protein n=1 Tax=Pseudogemmobacter bohemicus TaxID=2250708 RepID=UPI001300B559|nr:hypothetical protein [Pseudogemmobacter bohemicus]
MSSEKRSMQEILSDQFRITAELSRMTGEYHRLLQKVAAAGFARQMAEDDPGPALAEAERIEIAAKLTAETCELQVEALEKQLSALGRELSDLT